MVAAKEKSLSFKSESTIQPMDSKYVRPTATKKPSTVVNRISSYDFRTRKNQKPHYGLSEKIRPTVPVENQQRPRKYVGENAPRVRRLHWAPELSLYRGYFVPRGVDPLGLKVWKGKVVAKSFIDGMVGGIGTLPNNTPGWYVTQAAFLAFAGFTRAAFKEHPNTDVKDEEFRLYTELNVEWECDCNDEIKWAKIASTDTGAGKEPGGFSGTINLKSRIWLTSETSGEVLWFGWGKPDPRVEFGFQIISRTSVNIWHRARVNFYCKNGEGFLSKGLFEGSDFPSHKLWIQSKQHGYKKQGKFSSLWRSDPKLGPTFVTEDGTGPFQPQFGVD